MTEWHPPIDFSTFKGSEAEGHQFIEQRFARMGRDKFMKLGRGVVIVHLDDVEDLGSFMELEVMLQEGQSEAEGQAIAEDLMERLGVARSDLLEGAYMDLLESSAESSGLPK